MPVGGERFAAVASDYAGSYFGVLPTNQPYFVMEFLRGRTVGEAIFTGFMDSQIVCHIGLQIARGLQAVHKQNVVHRDLKPDNIFLIDPETSESPEESGKASDEEPAFVKIMDFGIAKSVNSNLASACLGSYRPSTCHPSKHAASRSTGARISTRSAASCTKC